MTTRRGGDGLSAEAIQATHRASAGVTVSARARRGPGAETNGRGAPRRARAPSLVRPAHAPVRALDPLNRAGPAPGRACISTTIQQGGQAAVPVRGRAPARAAGCRPPVSPPISWRRGALPGRAWDDGRRALSLSPLLRSPRAHLDIVHVFAVHKHAVRGDAGNAAARGGGGGGEGRGAHGGVAGAARREREKRGGGGGDGRTRCRVRGSEPLRERENSRPSPPVFFPFRGPVGRRDRGPAGLLSPPLPHTTRKVKAGDRCIGFFTVRFSPSPSPPLSLFFMRPPWAAPPRAPPPPPRPRPRRPRPCCPPPPPLPRPPPHSAPGPGPAGRSSTENSRR